MNTIGPLGCNDFTNDKLNFFLICLGLGWWEGWLKWYSACLAHVSLNPSTMKERRKGRREGGRREGGKERKKN
jgi:hypothetical protein